MKGRGECFDLEVGERTAGAAASSYRRTTEEASLLRDLVAFDWDALDEWFCEDEQLFGHARDPYSRIDTFRTTRHVWTYADPQHDGEPVRALLCFFNERVDLEIDGELQERPAPPS